MKKILFILLGVSLLKCNSYEDKINLLLKNKRSIELSLDTATQKKDSLLPIIGYTEIYDSIRMRGTYLHPELVDSFMHLKEEIKYLHNELGKIKYSIDSLQELR